MGRKKKLINNSGIPQHEIEHIARCILPDILAYYESEEGQREFQDWLAQREAGKGREKQVSNHIGCRQLGDTFSHATGASTHAFRG